METNSCLEELPPSAKLVYKVLEYDGPLTQKRIVEQSMLSARTVRYALDRLDDCECIDERVYFQDARQSLYTLAITAEDHTEEPAPEAEAA
ncbi:MAG: ArsR family transcriptional regulator [Halodesulfurarchaeum sp.]